MTRAVLVLLSLGMNPKVALLPEGKDPADVLKNSSGDTWKNILKESVPFIVYQTTTILRTKPSPHVLAKELKTAIFPYLARIVSNIERGSSIEMISQLTGISAQNITSDFEAYQKTLTPQEKKEVVLVKNEGLSLYERYVGLLQKLPPAEKNAFELSFSKISFEDRLLTQPPLAPDRLELLGMLIDREYTHHTIEEIKKVIEELLEKITKKFYQELQTIFTQELATAQYQNDETRTAELLVKLRLIHERSRE